MITLVYLEVLSMHSIHHFSVDLQLYQTAWQVQWNDPQRWTGLVHPLMSFLGCIETLMEASDVEVLVSTAFGGNTNIISGKAWTKANIIAVLLHRVYSQHCLNAMMSYFFVTCHHNYARYMNWYVRQMEQLPQHAKEDLLAVAHVSRHSDGGTAVPVDQFGEKTYIKRGKCAGGMKGISTSTEQVELCGPTV